MPGQADGNGGAALPDGRKEPFLKRILGFLFFMNETSDIRHCVGQFRKIQNKKDKRELIDFEESWKLFHGAADTFAFVFRWRWDDLHQLVHPVLAHFEILPNEGGILLDIREIVLLVNLRRGRLDLGSHGLQVL